MPSLPKRHPFTLKSHALGWSLQQLQQHHIVLSNLTSLETGWFKLSIKAKNKAAKLWLQQQPELLVYLNDHDQGVTLVSEQTQVVSLVFLQHEPLHSIRLSYAAELTTENVQFEIVVKTIKPLFAWLNMLQVVSRRHRGAGQSGSYIYRITRARHKRAGWQHALKKLIDAYHPALTQQLISSAPYQYWQLKHEPELALPEFAEQSHTDLCFTIFLTTATDEERILQTIASLQQQSYQHWCLRLDSNAVSDKLKKALDAETRVVFYQQKTFVPAAASYLLFLHAGDRLATHALKTFAVNITMQDKNSIFYSDHDFITSSGRRILPHFKPQWSPDYMLSKDYIDGAFVVPATLLQALFMQQLWWQTPRQQLLLLALIEQRNIYPSLSVIHLAYVLFHFCAKHNKKSSLRPNKACSELLLKFAATEKNFAITITKGNENNIYKINYPIPSPAPLVTLLIPTRDSLDITRNCVESILHKTEYSNYQIIILDNQSTELTTLAWFDAIQQHEKVTVLRYDFPFNYSAINNFGVQHAKGELIGLINNDVEVINSSWLTEMVQHAIRPEIGCVGAKLYFFDDTIQHGGVIMGLWGLAGHSHKHYLRSHPGYMDRLITIQNYSAVTAACLLVRKDVFEQVNGLDEENLVVAFNDVDLCLKVQQAGYRNLWTPYAELYHYESKSRGKEDTPAKKAREKREIDFMRQKWPVQTQSDPYYSPHLTHCSENFSIGIE